MITPQDFIHREDVVAHLNMKAISGFAAAVKTFMKLGMEQYYHCINMASKIRLCEKADTGALPKGATYLPKAEHCRAGVLH